MTDVNNLTNYYSPVSGYFTQKSITGSQSRDYSGAVLQDSALVQQLSPEQITDLQSFYNKALCDIDTIRHPDLPQLKPYSDSSSSQNDIVSLNDKKARSENGNSILKPKVTLNNIEKTIDSFNGTVYSDPDWGKKHNVSKLESGEYMFQCEGGSMFKPIRSGKEMELYNKIKEHIKNNDVTKPDNKISPEKIMQWSLEVNRKNGKVCIEDAFLTCHNVMRVLGRTGDLTPDKLEDGDPVKKIWMDLKGARIDKYGRMTENGKEGSLYKILEANYDGKNHTNDVSPSMGYGNLLFDPSNRHSPFKAYADTGVASAGCAYHLWVGALASSLYGQNVADSMIAGEGEGFKKGMNFLDNLLSGKGFKVDSSVKELVDREMPWGFAGSTLGESVTSHKSEPVPPGYENYPVK